MANAYDVAIEEYEQRKSQTENELNNLANEKQNALDAYEKNYNQQINDYENLMKQQQENIDTWANTQKENQQKQTDFNISLIEQQKKEGEKQTNTELGNAYIDYQKGLNQFGGSAETLASQGLGGTGFAKNQDIAMNITYQNRVASAKSALQKANVEWTNQINQALLNNDTKLAEIALQQMQQQYQLALQGFEYKTTMENNRISYLDNLNNTYYNRQQNLQTRIDNYTANINSTRLAKQQAAEQAAQQAAAREWEREKYYTSLNASNNKQYGDTPTQTNSPSVATSVGAGVLGLLGGKTSTKSNTPVGITGFTDKNATAAGYKPTGKTVAQLYGKGKTDSAGNSLDNAIVYYKNGNYYVIDSNKGLSLIKR